MQLVNAKLNTLYKMLKTHHKKLLIALVLVVAVTGVWFFFLRKKNKESFNNGNAFTMYGVEWCGHCQKTKPEILKLKESPPSNCDINIIDCEKNAELCKNEGVQGYPTCKLSKSDGSVVPYSGERTESAFRQFIKKNS